MDERSYRICSEMLDHYTKENQYEYQLLYLICYLSNAGSMSDFRQLKETSKINIYPPIIHNIHM